MLLHETKEKAMGNRKLKSLIFGPLLIQLSDGKDVLYLKPREEVDLDKVKPLNTTHVNNLIRKKYIKVSGGDTIKADSNVTSATTETAKVQPAIPEEGKQQTKGSGKAETDSKKR